MSSSVAPTPYPSQPRSHGLDAPPTSLWDVFRLLDENGDGVLSREEMRKAFAKLGLQFAGEHLDAIMGSGRGGECSLSFQDFQSLYDSACCVEDEDDSSSDENRDRLTNVPVSSPGGENQTRGGGGGDDVWEAFCIYDKNGDGVIDAAELQSVLSNLGFAQASDLGFCQKAIRSVDVNSDGVVDFSEFQAMMNMTAH